jgi:hypothetical protein
MDKVVNEIPGMGKALVTAILLVAFPDKYGVWNGTSEAALMALKVWPDFARGLSFGQKYEVVNRALLGLSKELNVDLWTLDALHWRAVPEVRGTDDELPVSDETNEYGQCFGLERHLHQFLFDNWDQTSLGKEWALYTVPGDAEAGYEYPTDIGRIDLLAKHRRQNRWLVVELKRGQSSDDTVGQILRYVAWVRQHLAGKNEKIEGLIICHEIDERLRYAVSEIQHVRAMVYEVSFSLKDDTGNKQKGNLT